MLRHPEKEIHFVICENCFWCASYLSASAAEQCPLCAESRIEAIPISSNEEFTFNHEPKAGLVLNFAVRSE